MPAKILLVDDDSEFREELKAYLEGYEVIGASSGEEALAVLRRPNEIDLVILDVRMPGRDGTEVLREMKRLDPGLGIIILTGYSSKDVAIEALKSHADDYVEKSFGIGRIPEVVERLLEEGGRGRRRQAAADETKIGRVKEYLRRNCRRMTRLEDAARAAALSPKYLSRLFKLRAGVGFSVFRQRIVVDEAKKLLRARERTVADIAGCLGYANPESFIRVFKKLTGMTPARYRSGRRNRAGRKRST